MQSSNDKAAAPADPLANYIDRPTFCKRFGITKQTAERMAHKGRGPRVTRLGRRAFYHLDDINAWLEKQRAKGAGRFEGEAR